MHAGESHFVFPHDAKVSTILSCMREDHSPFAYQAASPHVSSLLQNSSVSGPRTDHTEHEAQSIYSQPLLDIKEHIATERHLWSSLHPSLNVLGFAIQWLLQPLSTSNDWRPASLLTCGNNQIIKLACHPSILHSYWLPATYYDTYSNKSWLIVICCMFQLKEY